MMTSKETAAQAIARCLATFDRDALASELTDDEHGQLAAAALSAMPAQGWRDTVEQCAKVADARARHSEIGFIKALEMKHGEHQTHFAARNREAMEIADAIRALTPPTNEQEA